MKFFFAVFLSFYLLAVRLHCTALLHTSLCPEILLHTPFFISGKASYSSRPSRSRYELALSSALKDTHKHAFASIVYLIFTLSFPLKVMVFVPYRQQSNIHYNDFKVVLEIRMSKVMSGTYKKERKVSRISIEHHSLLLLVGTKDALPYILVVYLQYRTYLTCAFVQQPPAQGPKQKTEGKQYSSGPEQLTLCVRHPSVNFSHGRAD